MRNGGAKRVELHYLVWPSTRWWHDCPMVKSAGNINHSSRGIYSPGREQSCKSTELETVAYISPFCPFPYCPSVLHSSPFILVGFFSSVFLSSGFCFDPPWECGRVLTFTHPLEGKCGSLAHPEAAPEDCALTCACELEKCMSVWVSCSDAVLHF